MRTLEELTHGYLILGSFYCIIKIINHMRLIVSTLDYYRAVLLGVVIGMVFLTGIYVFISPVENAEALDTKGSFTVVDNYKGCDVVQWHYSMLAEYKYFLDCNK